MTDQPTLDFILDLFALNIQSYGKKGKTHEATKQSLADYIQRALVGELQDILFKHEETQWVKRGNVDSHENIVNANAIRNRIKALSTIKVPLVVGDSPVTPGKGGK